MLEAGLGPVPESYVLQRQTAQAPVPVLHCPFGISYRFKMRSRTISWPLGRFAGLLALLAPGAGHAMAQEADVEAQLIGCSKPLRPENASGEQAEGTVRLDALVQADGRMSATKIMKSSGIRVVDRSSGYVFSCDYAPARRNGQAQPGWITLQYTWVLDPPANPGAAAQVRISVTQLSRAASPISTPSNGASDIR